MTNVQRSANDNVNEVPDRSLRRHASDGQCPMRNKKYFVVEVPDNNARSLMQETHERLYSLTWQALVAGICELQGLGWSWCQVIRYVERTTNYSLEEVPDRYLHLNLLVATATCVSKNN